MTKKLPFLSSEWWAEVGRMRAQQPDRPTGPAEAVQVNQIITDVPFGDGTLLAHIDTSSGEASFGLGHLDLPDVTITLDYQVARAMLIEGNPQAAMRAFMTGQLQVTGEMTKLIAAQRQMPNIYGPALADRIRQITA
jgi:hypothetical protein